LKQTLTAHCELWKTKLTGLLNNLAAAELRSLHDYFKCVASSNHALAIAPAALRIAAAIFGSAGRQI
jgi:dynein heavy chain